MEEKVYMKEKVFNPQTGEEENYLEIAERMRDRSSHFKIQPSIVSIVLLISQKMKYNSLRRGVEKKGCSFPSSKCVLQEEEEKEYLFSLKIAGKDSVDLFKKQIISNSFLPSSFLLKDCLLCGKVVSHSIHSFLTCSFIKSNFLPQIVKEENFAQHLDLISHPIHKTPHKLALTWLGNYCLSTQYLLLVDLQLKKISSATPSPLPQSSNPKLSNHSDPKLSNIKPSNQSDPKISKSDPKLSNTELSNQSDPKISKSDPKLSNQSDPNQSNPNPSDPSLDKQEKIEEIDGEKQENKDGKEQKIPLEEEYSSYIESFLSFYQKELYNLVFSIATKINSSGDISCRLKACQSMDLEAWNELVVPFKLQVLDNYKIKIEKIKN